MALGQVEQHQTTRQLQLMTRNESVQWKCLFYVDC